MRVTVLGAARSGRAAASLALQQGHSVVLTDQRSELPPMEGVSCVFGRHERHHLTEADLVVVSPGVPASAPPVKWAQGAGVRVVGELGFAAEHLTHDGPLIAITGTNGKSTVTQFTAQLLQAAGQKVFAGGNLGTPLSQAVGTHYDALVVEVSSYQMELPSAFAPTAAVILNLTPDHLKRHGDMAGYAAAKARIFDHMAPDGFAGVLRQPELEAAVADKPGRRVWLNDVDQGFDAAGLNVLGDHNRWNAAVACLLAETAGVTEPDLSALSGLPHRLEVVPSYDGRTWINDSKATNLDAARIGIAVLTEPGVVLLGGRGKAGADYGALKDLLATHRVVCFGEAGRIIQGAVGGEYQRSLSKAVRRARALPGRTVLLSPACSSFDAFTDFEHRGRKFRDLVQEIS
jgi:UDP-N-acetylmuramoylalanine--D-glutamate ligase